MSGGEPGDGAVSGVVVELGRLEPDPAGAPSRLSDIGCADRGSRDGRIKVELGCGPTNRHDGERTTAAGPGEGAVR